MNLFHFHLETEHLSHQAGSSSVSMPTNCCTGSALRWGVVQVKERAWGKARATLWGWVGGGMGAVHCREGRWSSKNQKGGDWVNLVVPRFIATLVITTHTHRYSIQTRFLWSSPVL